MATYDLYGFRSTDIVEAKRLLENVFGIEFEFHDSSYQGGDYFRWGKIDAEHFVLKRNVDPFDDQPAEMSFSMHPILLYVNDTLRSADLEKKITQKVKGSVLLRHEDY